MGYYIKPQGSDGEWHIVVNIGFFYKFNQNQKKLVDLASIKNTFIFSFTYFLMCIEPQVSFCEL